MFCEDLNGLKDCAANKPSIVKINVFLFNEMSEYVYESDNLDKVTGFSALSLPTTYRPNPKTSIYNGSQSLDNVDIFNHKLTLGFPKLDEDKREELQKLKNLELTIIFEDANGKSWIMGQKFPSKFESLELETGARGGSNGYKLIFSSIERTQLKEASKVSDSCFTSFKGLEIRRSIITIENAPALDWKSFDLSADDRVVHYDANPALNPTAWLSSPSTVASDAAQLLQMLEAGGSVYDMQLNYNQVSQSVTITVFSFDTTFGSIIVDGVFQAPSDVTIVLQLTTILSPIIANASTIIQVSDSNGVLFSGGYGTQITGVTGVSNLTNVAVIQVSDLYSTSTKFTATVLNIPCSTTEYEYIFENTLIPCKLDTEHEFFKGELLSSFIPYVQYTAATNTGVQCPRFQNIQLNLLGNIYTFYQDRQDWHDDFTTLVNDISIAIAQAADTIDANSLIFTEESSGVRMEFKTIGFVPEDKVAYCKCYSKGLGSTIFQGLQGFTQSRVLDLHTNAPVSSIITHEDGFSNEITGEYLVDIASNSGFDLLKTPTSSNTSIDNIGLLWAYDGSQPYDENSKITTRGESATCLTPTLESEFVNCFDSYDSQSNNYTMSIELNVSSGSLNTANQFEINILGKKPVILSCIAGATPTSNSHYLTNLLNSIDGVQVLQYEFNFIFQVYVIQLKIDNSVNIISIKEFGTANNRVFSMSSITPIFTNTLTKKINPYALIDWFVPSVVFTSATGQRDLTFGNWQETTKSKNAVSFNWDLSTEIATVSRLVPNPPFGNQNLIIQIYSYTDYPTAAVAPVVVAIMASGQNSISISGISAALGGLSNGGFVSMTNEFGFTVIETISFSNNDSTFFAYDGRKAVLWGTQDSLEYIGLTPTVKEPVYITEASGCSSTPFYKYELIFDYATDGGDDGVFKLNGDDYGTGFDNTNAGNMQAALEYILQTSGFGTSVEIEEDNEVFTITTDAYGDFVLTFETDVPNFYTFTKTII